MSRNTEPSAEFVEALDKICKLASTRYSELSSLPTIASPESLSRGIHQILTQNLPDHGLGLKSTVEFLLSEVLPTLAQGQVGPRYFGFVTGGVTKISTLADFLTTIYDSNVQVHLPKETLSTLIEAHTITLLLELLSLPVSKFTGTITTGATSSNVLGLACGRESILRTILSKPGEEQYSFAEEGFGGSTPAINVFAACSHASVKKAAALVGIGRARVRDLGKKSREIGNDHDHEQDEEMMAERRAECLDFDLELLEAELRKSHESKQGAIVVLSIGEVNTGFISRQTPQVKDLCSKYKAWLHIDAAFSAFICLLDGKGWISDHMSLADSITSDAHKALNVPYDCGLFFVKRTKEGITEHASELEEVLGNGKAAAPAYLSTSKSVDQDESEDDEEALERAAYAAGIPSPLIRNIENSRRFRALPVFATLLSFGRCGLQSMVSRNADFAAKIAEWIRGDEVASRCYSLVTPRSLAISTVVLFRANPRSCPVEEFKNPDGHEILTRKIKETRQVYVTQTVWSGVGAVRLAVSNWSTGYDQVAEAQESDGGEDLRIVKEVLLKVMGIK